MAEINTADLTEACIDGTGVFDELQKAADAHIQGEYTKNRIRGAEYSQVYLGGMQAVLQNSVAFILGRQKADKEADLLNEKITTEGLVQDKLRAEIKLIDAQILVEEVKLWVTKAQVSNDLTITEAPTNFLYNGVLGHQIKKTDAEIDLLNQKRRTEQAQTQGGIANEESVLGKEILLRQRQADGFLRDAEQKLSKIVGDAYGIQFSTLDGPGEGGSVPSNFTSGGVDRIISKARAGIQA